MTGAHPYAVILAGGSGTRFWPLSRRLAPKQLLTLTGDRTMLQETVLRITPAVAPDRVMVITGRELSDEARRQLRVIGIPAVVVDEPVGRNTAPAIAVAAHRLLAADPDAVMVVLPSDHVVSKPEAFLDALNAAIRAAADGWLVTIGIVPRRPETGYGYIQRGPALPGDRAYRVERFVEKPDRATAERYVADGGYLWNAGMFVWRADAIVDELRRHAPG
ncbi:MAG TPA: mannose-1-phosphate guanylyltransferase, partial [Nitrospiria bacterium]|nr:mannose-1-phosphate guanylyltransferase [Nitrospiria bacterium]